VGGRRRSLLGTVESEKGVPQVEVGSDGGVPGGKYPGGGSVAGSPEPHDAPTPGYTRGGGAPPCVPAPGSGAERSMWGLEARGTSVQLAGPAPGPKGAELVIPCAT
jgi:hypothetical protein